jgi:hypothetical protein
LPARPAAELLDLLAPVLRVGLGHLGLAHDPVEQQAQQLLLVADVPVQRRGAGAELVRELAHAQALHALTLEQHERGVDDRLAAQRAPLTLGLGALAPPGRFRDRLGHLTRTVY